MMRWQIGKVRITKSVEADGRPTSGLFLFPEADPEFVRRHAWLRPHFATDDGKLASACGVLVGGSWG